MPSSRCSIAELSEKYMTYAERKHHCFDVFKQHMYDAFTRLQLPQHIHHDFWRQIDYYQWNPFVEVNRTNIYKIIHTITLNYDNLLQRALIRCTMLSTLHHLSSNPHIRQSYLNFERAKRDAVDIEIHLKRQIKRTHSL